jgi:hypothetical protein
MEYYVVCKRHAYRKDYAVLFWGKNFNEYTYNIDDAGIYTEEEIVGLPESHFRDDKPVSVEIVDKGAILSVIDNARLGKVYLNTGENRRTIGTSISELHTGPTNWDSENFCTPEYFLVKNKNVASVVRAIKKHKGLTLS